MNSQLLSNLKKIEKAYNSYEEKVDAANSTCYEQFLDTEGLKSPTILLSKPSKPEKPIEPIAPQITVPEEKTFEQFKTEYVQNQPYRPRTIKEMIEDSAFMDFIEGFISSCSCDNDSRIVGVLKCIVITLFLAMLLFLLLLVGFGFLGFDLGFVLKMLIVLPVLAVVAGIFIYNKNVREDNEEYEDAIKSEFVNYCNKISEIKESIYQYEQDTIEYKRKLIEYENQQIEYENQRLEYEKNKKQHDAFEKRYGKRVKIAKEKALEFTQTSIKQAEKEFQQELNQIEFDYPSKYYSDIDRIIDIVSSSRADTLKEAINVLEEDLYKERMLEKQDRLLYEQREAQIEAQKQAEYAQRQAEYENEKRQEIMSRQCDECRRTYFECPTRGKIDQVCPNFISKW